MEPLESYHSWRTSERLRAFVELELSQAEPTSPVGQAQNPTTRGTPGMRTHIVQDGDRTGGLWRWTPVYARCSAKVLWRLGPS